MDKRRKLSCRSMKKKRKSTKEIMSIEGHGTLLNQVPYYLKHECIIPCTFSAA
jgi:hypothetical protein